MQRTPTRWPHRGRSLIVIALIGMAAAAATVTRPAAAQVLPLVPGPMTTPELMDHADRMGLSDQQRLQLLPMHDEYMQQYERFYERDIVPLKDDGLAAVRQFVTSRFRPPPREDLERLLTRYDAVVRRVHTMDTALFGRIGSILTDAQQPALARVRTLREMALYEDLVGESTGEFNDGAGLNLTALVERLDLEPAVRDRIRLILTSYESSRLSIYRDGRKIIYDAAAVVLDVIDQMRLRERTPEEVMALMQEPDTITNLRATFDEASKPFQKAAAELSELNLRTFRKLLDVLDEDNRETLREEYFRRAYRRIYRGPGEWRLRFDAALQMPDLDPETLELLRAQRANFVRRDNAMLDAIASDLEQARSYRTSGVLFEIEHNPIEEKVRAFRERRDALGTSAEDALTGILGPERLAALDEMQRAADKADEDDAPTSARAGRGGGGGGARPRREHRHRDGAVEVSISIGDDIADTAPAPVSVADLNAIAAALDLDPAQQQPLLQAAYDTYRQRYDALIETARAEAEAGAGAGPEAQADAAAGAGAGGGKGPTIAQQLDQREARLVELRALDDAFFDDLALLFTEAGPQIVERFRQSRRRAVCNRVTRGLVWGFGDEEAYVDLAAVLHDGAPEALGAPSVPALLQTYSERMQPLAAKRLDDALEADRARTVLASAHERGEPPEALVESLRERTQDAQRRVQQANAEAVRINRETLDHVLAAVPEALRWDVRYAYNREAYPDIYEETTRASKAVETARTLSGLTAAQAGQIDEAAYTWRSRYFDLSERMVALRRERPMVNTFDFRMPEKDVIDREIELERLHFKRGEAEQRLLTRLRLILDDAQEQRVAELRDDGSDSG